MCAALKPRVGCRESKRLFGRNLHLEGALLHQSSGRAASWNPLRARRGVQPEHIHAAVCDRLVFCIDQRSLDPDRLDDVKRDRLLEECVDRCARQGRLVAPCASKVAVLVVMKDSPISPVLFVPGQDPSAIAPPSGASSAWVAGASKEVPVDAGGAYITSPVPVSAMCKSRCAARVREPRSCLTPTRLLPPLAPHARRGCRRALRAKPLPSS